MWKAFSRSICEVVERRVGFTAFRSDVSKQNGHDVSKGRKAPSHRQLTSFIPQLKTYCPLKHLRTSRYKQTSYQQTGERREQSNDNHAKWNDPPLAVCLGAMGWSTALVLGWYLCPPLGRRLFGETYHKEVRFWDTKQYCNLERTVHAQSPIQPLGVRPLTYTSSVDETSSTNSFHSSFTSSSGDGEELLTRQRGPFTPEEALDEVSRVFEAASHALSGDVENKLGMVCMANGQHSKAMNHFRRASHYQHAVAAYNMGQCYELGLGTPRNLKKAAKWYKISSDRGHPSAMYNLAVFLANGWGELSEDQNRAHELLLLAANLGLKEAKDALISINEGMYAARSDNEYNGSKNSTDEFLEMIGATSRRVENTSSGVKPHSTRTYLSHLDWLDLSEPSSASTSSGDMFNSKEEGHLYSGLYLGSDSSVTSSNSGKAINIKKGSDPLYFEVDSASGEFLDEAANCRIYEKEPEQ